ncbi:type II toxin-antitoxin system RelE/ParE family toxin [Nitrospira sp. M1]
MAKVTHPKRVIVYVDKNGKEPFSEWVEDLRDTMGRKRILIRIGRLQQGNYGDCKSVGEGVSELKMTFGPGYRVYIGEEGRDVVVLLCGGEKSTQQQDIQNAKVYWKEYLSDG